MKIGVLGGIGPEATGTFYLKLIDKMQRSGLIKSNKDFPQIIINSIPAPELVFDDIKDDDLESYIKGLEELDAQEPDFIVMVCNTIHLYHDMLQKHIKAPLIDLRKEVHQRLMDSGKDSVTIIGTPGTINLGLYDFPGINYFNPDKEEQQRLSNAIFHFNRGEAKEVQVARTMSIIKNKLDKGAQSVLLACTEFAVMLEDGDIPKLDTIDILVDGVIKRLG